MSKTPLIPLALILGLLSGCSPSLENDQSVVVRVGEATLSQEDTHTWELTPQNEYTNKQQMVSQWINQEVLFQAAVAHGYDRDKTLLQAVSDYRRELIGKAYLQSLLQRRIGVSSDDIKAYYQAHRGSFTRQTEEAKILHFLVDSKSKAREIKSILLRSGVSEKRKKLLADYGVNAVTVRKGAFIELLNDAIFKARRRVVGPIQTPYGYHTIEILEKYQEGTVRGLDEVYDEIQQYIFQQRSALLAKQILDSLKNTIPIEIFTENLK